jgi:hypothetical protein
MEADWALQMMAAKIGGLQFAGVMRTSQICFTDSEKGFVTRPREICDVL